MKKSKQEVDYGPGHRMGDHCGVCRYFNAPERSCDKVAGRILPGDWCKLFERRDDDG